MGNVSSHLNLSDLECKCGCRQAFVVQSLVDNYETITAYLGFSPPINSWNRCPKHSVEVGGSPTDAHTTGEAFDLATASSIMRKFIIEAIIAARFRRYGVDKGGKHIHADVSTTKTQDVFWIE